MRTNVQLAFALVLCAAASTVSARWVSTDPVQAQPNTGANFNRYWYANNNPYKFTDPDGRSVTCAEDGTSCTIEGDTFVEYVADRITVQIIKNAALVQNAINESSDGGAKEPDPATGSEKDSADSSGQLTKAGRAQQKHGDRDGSAFDPAKGTPDDKNAQGQNTLDSITNSPDKTSESNQRGGTDVRESPDGRGARFDKDGKFTGFIEPKKP